jgi:ribonuclease Z
MQITFLGTGAAAPTRARNTSAWALRLPERAALWLFDCGEGTQHQFLRSPLRLSQLERVFVTHLHGDHLFGLPGLLASRSLQNGGTTPVTLHGPDGLEAFVRCALDVSGARLGFPLRFETVQGSGVVYEDDEFTVACAPMDHGAVAFGYAVREKDRPGRFDAETARALGVPEGPLFGRLKDGEAVTLPDGRTVHGTGLVGPPIPGRAVVYCGDTAPTPRAVELARSADVLIHEATFAGADAALARRARHSTAAQAAAVARDAGVTTLILTHLSPRYENDDGAGLGELFAEARAVFPNTLIARDLWDYAVARRGTDAPAAAPGSVRS